jgi:hypothetical protein
MVRVLKSPAGEGKGSFKLPFALSRLEAVLSQLGREVRNTHGRTDPVARPFMTRPWSCSS